MKSECVTSDKLYQSMSSYKSNTKFWTKFGPKKPSKGAKNFFDSWYYLNLLDIMVVYHSMQNEEILMSSSWENKFGDKNNLETSLNRAQIWPKNFFSAIRPPLSFRDHVYLLKYAKSEKFNDSNLNNWPKTSNLGKFGPSLP